jgi:hypothetical protein
MELSQYIQLKEEIEARLLIVEDALHAFPKGEFGLVEMTPEFRKANIEFHKVFNELRNLNKITPAKIKRELAMSKRFKK